MRGGTGANTVPLGVRPTVPSTGGFGVYKFGLCRHRHVRKGACKCYCWISLVFKITEYRLWVCLGWARCEDSYLVTYVCDGTETFLLIQNMPIENGLYNKLCIYKHKRENFQAPRKLTRWALHFPRTTKETRTVRIQSKRKALNGALRGLRTKNGGLLHSVFKKNQLFVQCSVAHCVPQRRSNPHSNSKTVFYFASFPLRVRLRCLVGSFVAFFVILLVFLM